jgi:hypothetical protein
MKRVCLTLTQAICFLILLSSASASRRTEIVQWGQPVGGLQMSLTSTDSNLQVALRNIGDRDVTLNLGATIANGKVQLPSNIGLNFTDLALSLGPEAQPQLSI